MISWPTVSRTELAARNAVARWLRVVPNTARLEKLVGGAVTARVGTGALGDPHAAACSVRIDGVEIEVRAASGFVRAFAQRLLGGPEELAAPRALTEAETAMWTLLVATAVEDLGIRGEVWPSATKPTRPTVVLDVTVGGSPLTVDVRAPHTLQLRAPPERIPRWAAGVVLELPVVVGRCILDRADLSRLKVRSVVTIDRPPHAAELVILGGVIGLALDPEDPVVATVSTEYVPRDMALPDEARVELTVGVGTAKMSLRQVMGLSVGEVVPLGRPPGGPFEVRAEGTLIGQGELVDVDGELGVRIVSFVEEK